MYQEVKPRPVPHTPELFLQRLCHLAKMFSQGERNELRLLSSMECMGGVSPYRLPVLSRCLVPVPPPRLRRRRRRVLSLRAEPCMPRRFYPTTAFNEQVLIRVSGLWPSTGVFLSSLVCLPRAGRCACLLCTKKMYNY